MEKLKLNHTVTTSWSGDIQKFKKETLRVVGYIRDGWATYGPYHDGRVCYDVIHITSCGRAFRESGWQVGSEPRLNPIYELDSHERESRNIAEWTAKFLDMEGS